MQMLKLFLSMHMSTFQACFSQHKHFAALYFLCGQLEPVCVHFKSEQFKSDLKVLI